MARRTLRRRTDSGVALILALLVLAVLIILIGQMTMTSLQNRTVSENQLADLQNGYAARSGYAQGVLYLQADLEKGTGVDSLSERWAQPIRFALGRARVEARVLDSERFVNLSRIVNDKGEEVPHVAAQLRRLVATLRHPPEIAERIVDYIDADTKGPYEIRARNEKLYSLEELLRVEGLPPEVLYGGKVAGEEKKGLLEFVTVWPREVPQGSASPAGAVNVNTAPLEVLASLSEKMTLPLAEEIVKHRSLPTAQGGFQDFQKVEDLKQVPGMNEEIYGSISAVAVVRSATFEIRVRSAVANVEKQWTYVVSRTPGDQAKIELLGSQRVNDFLSVRPPEEEKP